MVCPVILSLATVALGQQATDLQQPAFVNSTVYVMQSYELFGQRLVSCVGSGTLVSSDGLVLTNYHLVRPVGPCKGDQVIVAVSVRPNEPPIPAYMGEVVQSNELYDLAVLRISTGLDGSEINTSVLNLPHVTIGDPSVVLTGTSLSFAGFPEPTSTTASAINGDVSGITSEKGATRSAWFRTTSDLGGVMSGGGAYNTSGELVGVLTSAAGTDGVTPGPFCVSIQDSNRDGQINSTDACVPIGSPVTMIRPVSFALPLVDAAEDKLRFGTAPGIASNPPVETTSFTRLFFSPQVSDLGLPMEIVTSVSTGTSSMYLFFDYDNLRPGTSYEVRVTANGVPVPDLSVGPLSWGGGSQGTWFVGTDNTSLVEGTYEYTLLANGQPLASAQLSVEAQANEPRFSNLRFTSTSGAGGQQEPKVLFPAETVQITAQFTYDGLSQGQDWTEIWYLDGAEIFRNTRLWDQPASGQLSVSATNLAGLPLGRYRLELLIGQRLAVSGDIVLAGNQGPQNLATVFSNPRVASDRSRDGQPSGQVGDVFPLGVTSLFAFVDWDFMPPGTLWTYRWYLDGKLISDNTKLWDAGGVGQNFWVSLSSDSPLPEGTYAVEFLVQGSPMFSKTVSIGSGTRPVSGLGSSGDTVAISGTVIDALTGVAVSDASILVLNVKLTSASFNWSDADIFSRAESDQRGRFTLSKPLPKGQYYTVYVFADGYTTMLEDFFTIFSSQTSPVDMEIRLNRP